MSTEPDTTEEAEPGTPGAAEEATQDAADDSPTDHAGTTETDTAGEADATGATGESAESAVGDAGQPSEAEAELAAQRELRERIERRKAEKQGPIASGTKLSGTAADLLAAVRAVERGEKPAAAAVFRTPASRPTAATGASATRPAASASPSAAPVPVRQPQPAAPVARDSAVVPGSPEAVEAVRGVLTEGGAPDTLAQQVVSALGEGAPGQLRADPWQLLRVPGVRPEQADGFARALLGTECGPDDERRGRAVTVWLLEQAALAGHTVLDAAALTAALSQRGVTDPDAAVQSTVAEGEALEFQDAIEEAAEHATAHRDGEEAEKAQDGDEGDEGEERPVRLLIGLERYALAEESLADGLARIVNSLPKEAPEDWESSAGSSGSGSAAELIRSVAAHGLVLHTGGDAARAEPATLVAAARSLGLRVCAAAHTPDGRHRFAALLAPEKQPDTESESESDKESDSGSNSDAASDSNSDSVVTVAGLLAGAEGPGRDADGAFLLDLLVVLDAPQLDVESAAMVVESLPDGARLVLSGDPAVLWSAGPGRVFADLVAARTCPHVVSRTPDPGPIGELVSGVSVGELTQVEAPGKEVVIVPVRDAGEAVHRTVQLVADSVPRALGVPAEQTQVITPGHGGAAGTRALNSALKERLNPGPGRFGGFDPGDRIAYSPAPGRTVPGQVVKADAEGLHLECGGAPVVVPKERVELSVRHGWALTAHQAVGLHWPAAVVVLPGDAAPSLTRPWVYTAFGRAERHLSVVHGVDQALPRAVAEVPAKARTTRLPGLLRAQVPPTV